VATQSLDGDPQPAAGTVTSTRSSSRQRSNVPSGTGHPAWVLVDTRARRPCHPTPRIPDSWDSSAVAERPFAPDATARRRSRPPLRRASTAQRWRPRTGSARRSRPADRAGDRPTGKALRRETADIFSRPEMVGRAGRKFSPRSGVPGMTRVARCRTRVPTANHCRATGQRRPDAATGRVAHNREDARWSDVAGHLRARKTAPISTSGSGRAVVDQHLTVKWEELPLQTHARPERDLDGGRGPAPDAKSVPLPRWLATSTMRRSINFCRHNLAAGFNVFGASPAGQCRVAKPPSSTSNRSAAGGGRSPVAWIGVIAPSRLNSQPNLWGLRRSEFAGRTRLR